FDGPRRGGHRLRVPNGETHGGQQAALRARRDATASAVSVLIIALNAEAPSKAVELDFFDRHAAAPPPSRNHATDQGGMAPFERPTGSCPSVAKSSRPAGNPATTGAASGPILATSVRRAPSASPHRARRPRSPRTSKAPMPPPTPLSRGTISA